MPFGPAQGYNNSVGTATALDVLAGQTFSNSKKTNINGTMPNQAAKGFTPSGTGTVAIPAGYYDGSGNVAQVSVPATDLLTGSSVAGVAGTMPNNSGSGGYVSPVSVGWGGSTAYFRIPTGAYLTATQTGYTEVNAAVANLSAGNVRQGVTIGGVSGTSIQASGNAGAAQVLTGYSASNSSGGFNGSIPVQTSSQITPSTTQQNLPAGYYDGSHEPYVSAEPNLVAGNILSGVGIFGVVGNVQRRAMASGTTTSGGNASITCTDSSGSSYPYNPLTVSGLSFIPTLILVRDHSHMTADGVLSKIMWGTAYPYNLGGTYIEVDGTNCYVQNGGFQVPVNFAGSIQYWEAYE